MSIRIEPLLEHPQHVGFVARLVYREFWIDVPGGLTEAYLAEVFGGRGTPGRVLLSLVALDGDEPVGCVHLIDNDDDAQPQLHPWLAAMVVVPERRGRGVGSALVRVLLQRARALGFARLWFGTDGPEFYERLGATRYRRRSESLWTMSFELGCAQGL